MYRRCCGRCATDVRGDFFADSRKADDDDDEVRGKHARQVDCSSGRKCVGLPVSPSVRPTVWPLAKEEGRRSRRRLLLPSVCA